MDLPAVRLKVVCGAEGTSKVSVLYLETCEVFQMGLSEAGLEDWP